MSKQIQLKIINPSIGTEFPLPAYETPMSAGVDLRAMFDEETFVIEPNKVRLIPTGIAVNMLDPNICSFILPRSGLGHKWGLILGNSIGTIDADYQGQLMVSCWNRSSEPYEIKRGERIAQLVFQPIIRASFDVVDEFEASERGEGGFGSSGRV